MNLVTLIYLASIAEPISRAFIVLGVFGTILLPIIIGFGYLIAHDFSTNVELINKARGHMKWVFPLSLIIWFIGLVIPNEKTIYLMTAGYATEQVIDNPRVQKISNDVLDVVEIKLEEMKGNSNEQQK